MPKDKIGDVKVMNNEYDNEKFFEEYAKMSRSKEGLKAAGEWHYQNFYEFPKFRIKLLILILLHFNIVRIIY